MKVSFWDRLTEKLGFRVLREGKKLEVVDLKEIGVLRLVFGYASFLLIAWGLYRFLFRLPQGVEELVLKPVVWLGALGWVVKRREKKNLSSLGLTRQGLRKSLGLGLSLGVVFALVGFLTGLIKYGGFGFWEVSFSGLGLAGAVLVSLVTALTEELAFRGFIFNRLVGVWGREGGANLVTAFLFGLIHLPMTIFVLNYDFWQVFAYGLIAFVYSLGAGFVFGRTKNVASSVLLHIFWRWPMIIFG